MACQRPSKEDRRARGPAVGAVVAHNGQEEEVGAVEPDHPRRFGGRAVHAYVAADAAYIGIEDREAVAGQNARFALAADGEMDLAVAALD